MKNWRDGFVGLAMALMMTFRPMGLWPSRLIEHDMKEEVWPRV